MMPVAMPDRPLTFAKLPPEPMTFYDKIRKANIMFPVLGLALMAGGSGAEEELLALQLHTIWVQFLVFDQALDGGCQRWLTSLGYRELRPTAWSRSAIAYTADGCVGKADLGRAYAELDSTYSAALRSRAQQTARKTQEAHLALSSRAKHIMAETARGSLGVPKTRSQSRRGVLLMSWRDLINENAGCTPRDFKLFMDDLRGPTFADGINPSGSKLPIDILRFLYAESDEWETEAMFSGCQMHLWMWWSRCFGLDIIVFDHGVSADDLPEFHLPVPLWNSGMARDLLSAAFRAAEAKGDDYTMSRMQRDHGIAGDLMTERTIAMLSDEVESYEVVFTLWLIPLREQPNQRRYLLPAETHILGSGRLEKGLQIMRLARFSTPVVSIFSIFPIPAVPTSILLPRDDVRKLRELLQRKAEVAKPASSLRDRDCTPLGGDLHRPKVWIEARSAEYLQTFGLVDGIETLSSELKALGFCVTDSLRGGWLEWMRALAEHRYVVCPSSWNSPGQVIVEAAVARVLVFSQPHRMNAQTLFPAFCMVSSVQEVVRKIVYLQANPDVHESLLREVDRNLELLGTLGDSEAEADANLAALLEVLQDAESALVPA